MVREAIRAAVEPRMTALIEEIRRSYGADRCAYPYVPMVREGYLDGPRILICGKGAGSWGLQYAGIEGIGPHSTLADVPDGDWYPEVRRVHEAFIENGAKRCLSGGEGGYAKGAWWRSLYSVTLHLLGRRTVAEGWDRQQANPEDAEYFFANVALTNLDKVARHRNNLDRDLRRIHERHYTLAEELEVLRPRLAWFPTGRGYDRHLKKALPRISSIVERGGGIADIEGLGFPAVRTHHPQYTRVFRTRATAEHLEGLLRDN